MSIRSSNRFDRELCVLSSRAGSRRDTPILSEDLEMQMVQISARAKSLNRGVDVTVQPRTLFKHVVDAK